MNENYLTSLSNDDFKTNISAVYDVLNNISFPDTTVLSQVAIQQLIPKIYTAAEVMRPITEMTNTIQNHINSSTETFTHIGRIIETMNDFPLNNNLTEISKVINTFPYKNPLNISPQNALGSFIEKQEKNTETQEEHPTSEKITISAPHDNRAHNKDEINILSVAYINLEIAVQKFKEVSHKSYSYIAERKLAVFGLSNAFVYFVTLAAEINPMLPFYFFSITTVIGLFPPKDK